MLKPKRIRLTARERDRDPARHNAGMDGWPPPHSDEQRAHYGVRASVLVSWSRTSTSGRLQKAIARLKAKAKSERVRL